MTAQVLDYSTRIEVRKGKKVTEKRIKIQVNDKESNWASHVEIPHSPNDKFKFLEAKVTDLSGNILKKLRKKDIDSRSNLSYAAFYQDNMIKEFDLYWNTYPYQIEYSYQIIHKEFFQIAQWYPALYTKMPTVNSSLEIEVPIDYDIAYDYSESIQFKETKDENRTLKWTYGGFLPPILELYSPPLLELIPSVSVVPINFNYGVSGSMQTWSSFGIWQTNLNQNTDELPDDEKNAIELLMKNVESDREKIKILYNYLQDETKYINVSIDVGGLKSYSADYVSKNKYGDCKALTTYMKAMLKYVGIESHYTLINAGSNVEKIKKDFPSQQFNHVILVVPLENDTLWLENTSNVNPINFVGTFTQDRLALLINDDHTNIIKTPTLDTSDVIEISTFDFKHDEMGGCKYAVTKKVKGKKFEEILYYKNFKSIEDQKEKLINDLAIKGNKIEEWDIHYEDRDKKILTISSSGNCDPQFRNISNIKVMYQNYIPIPTFEFPENRSQIVRINFPSNIKNTSSYHYSTLKDSDIQLPQSINISTKYGSYSTSYQMNETSITFREQFYLKKGEYPIDEYPQFYTFIDSIHDYQNQSQIIIK